jgi:hypothetical protein
MKGIPVGQASAAATPTIQFFSRLGDVLQDVYSGTYKVEDLTTASPTVKVAPTAFTAGEKLSTGRYVVPCDTTGYNQGSHRAVVVYKMESGGPDFYQVIPFEVLNTTDWVHMGQYLGYVSSKEVQDSGKFGTTTLAVLHKLIHAKSIDIERMCRRFFEPRYLTIKLDGKDTSSLDLHEAIIAVEKVEAVSRDSAQTLHRLAYGSDVWRAYNRHLDGDTSNDDRKDPRIELIGDLAYTSSEVPPATTYTWPHGEQNVWVTGVFGYTDPTPDPGTTVGAGVSIGEVPKELGTIVMALAMRDLRDPTYSSAGVHSPGSVKKQKTRDQEIQFGGTGQGGTASLAYSEMTGDPLLDRLLLKFAAPLDIGYARR